MTEFVIRITLDRLE